jgi:cleavage and polyadenylation specificity factor subunit 4
LCDTHEYEMRRTFSADSQPLDCDWWAERAVRVSNAARATQGARAQVCRFWLSGVCIAGDACRYRHVYVASRVPLCRFANTAVVCGPECPFRH